MPGNAASAGQSICVSGLAGSSWPVTNATALATLRWVTGMPACAGAATPAVTPGTTSKSTPGRAQRLGLLATAAEDERVAALQPHDLAPGGRVLDEQRGRDVLGHLPAAADLADVDQLGLGARVRERLRRDQAVVEHHVGAARSARARGR